MRISDWSSDVCSSDLQRAGGGGADRWRGHHQALRADQGADPPAATQSRLRADRGAAGLGLRHRRPVLRPGAQRLMAAVETSAAVPSLDALLSAQTVWRAGRVPTSTARGEPDRKSTLDALDRKSTRLNSSH